MRNRLGRLSAGLVALGLLAAGCGDDAGGSVNEVSAETTAAPSTSEAAVTTTTATESARAEAGFAEADVQITLTWEGHGDLDLFATGPVEGAEPELVSEGRGNGGPPGGQVVPVANEDGGTGFRGDAVVRCGELGPVSERIFWPAGQALSGQYSAFVWAVDVLDDCGDPIAYTLEIRAHGEEVALETGELTYGDYSERIQFELP